MYRLFLLSIAESPQNLPAQDNKGDAQEEDTNHHP